MRRGPVLIGLAVSAVCLWGFWGLATYVAQSPGVTHFDTRISAAVQSWRTPYMTSGMRAVTHAGGTAFIMIVTVGIVTIMMVRGRRLEAAFAAGALGVGMLLSTLAKGHFERPRPPVGTMLADLPITYSFPSGHSMASLLVASVVAWLVLRLELRPLAKGLAVAGCALYAIVVGVSRVYLGVHYPTDVTASWLLGGAWLAIGLPVMTLLIESTEGATYRVSRNR